MNSANELISKIISSKEDEQSIQHFLGLIYRDKVSIAGLVLVTCTLAAVVVYAVTPIYQATATLLIESNQANVVSVEQVYGVDATQREYYQTQFEILNSRMLTERVVDQLEILNHPDYVLRTDSGSSWRDVIPFLPPSKPPTKEQHRQDVISRFQDQIVVSPIRNTHLVDISFESEDPQMAARVANAVGEAYINSNLEARLNLTELATGWLTERLAEMQGDLEKAEKELQAFQDSENLVDVSGVQTLTARELDEQTQRLTAAREAMVAARNQYEAAGESSEEYNSRWETLAGVLSDSLVQNLRREQAQAENEFDEITKRYGPKHPKYVAARSKIVSTERAYRNRVQQIVTGFEDKYLQARADVEAIESSFESSKREIQEINRKTYKLSQLQRAVETNRQLYDMFFQRFQEANRAEFAAANARFVDRAVRPFSPVKPRKGLIIAGVAIFSFVVGVLLSLIRYTLDNTIKVAEELEEKLDLGVLGVIPYEKKNLDETNVARLYLDRKHDNFAEAIRSLRTSVVLSGLEKPHKITVVTSSLPGEGKTTVSSNLALTLGQMEKVLLVDADMRRPSLAQVYGLEKSSRGLSELVAGTGKGSECIQRLEGLPIDLLTSGAVPPNPLDLLSSRRFEELLNQLAEKYDRIVIDSAPTQAVSDSMVLSTKSDALIYVVKSDATPSKVAKNGIERLMRVGAPIIGAVLNQFDADAAQKYGYYGYGYSKYGYYGYGYASKSYS